MSNVVIDENKKRAMYSKIRAMESMNLKTNKDDDKTMVKEIMKIIHYEANRGE